MKLKCVYDVLSLFFLTFEMKYPFLFVQVDKVVKFIYFSFLECVYHCFEFLFRNYFKLSINMKKIKHSLEFC